MAAAEKGFSDWLAGFVERAGASGPGGRSIVRLTNGLQPLAEVVARDRAQPETVLPVWAYLARAITPGRVAAGRAVMALHRDTLAEIGARHRVPASVIAAIWGLESDFGRNRGAFPVVAALATLAHDGRRRAFFEAELLAAIRIAASGVVPPAAMTGSWAGAMGHTQIMPSVYLEHAAPLAGSGAADIGADEPGDALNTTAAILVAEGWPADLSWGARVHLPRGFALSLDTVCGTHGADRWRALGLGLPDDVAGPCRLVLPAGASGPAFVMTEGYSAILGYNPSPSYALAVALMADALGGGELPPLNWPENDPPLDRAGVRALQRRLAALGFDCGDADGIAGAATRHALCRYQAAAGLAVDGYCSKSALERLPR